MIYTIVGGTGTLGTEIVRQLTAANSYSVVDEPANLINLPGVIIPTNKVNTIRILSRDELKQKELKEQFPAVECYLGDIKDPKSLVRPFSGADVVFHVAALKHIDILQDNPEESVKTNIYGTVNVLDVAEDRGVKKVIFSSTDKAVHPINVYGMCKGISEHIAMERGAIVYRWANVLNSRGSVIKYFVDSIKQDRSVKLTHPDMTRFWIRIEDAVKFMLDTHKHASSQTVMIPPMKAAKVSAVIDAIGSLVGRVPNVVITDLRRGEKIHESIVPDLTSEKAEQYTFTELQTLLRPFV